MAKVDEMSIDELQSIIGEYKQNQTQIKSIIELEKDNDQIESKQKLKELQVLLKDVVNAIVFYEDALKFKTESETFNDTPVDQNSIGKVANVYYETDHTWNNAIINSIDETEFLCEISFIGYKEQLKVPFKYVKVYQQLPDSELIIGIICDCIFMEDGKWYEATITELSEKGVHVKYNNYNNEDIVSKECIRITPEQKVLNWKKKSECKDDKGNNNPKDPFAPFVIPAHLKISPADTEEQRFLKRKRVKNLKHKNKQKAIEHISKEKQNNWLNFNKQLSQNKSTGFTSMKTLPTK